MKTVISLRILTLCTIFSFLFTSFTNAQTGTEPTITTSTNYISNLSYYFEQGPSPTQSLTLTFSNLEGDVEVNPPNGFEVSTDGLTFQNIPITVPSSTLEITIFTRLRENQNIDSFNGNLTITSANANTKTIQLSGEIWVNDEWDFVENFNNSSLSGSYQDNTFIGNNNISWNYISSRNEQGYGNNYLKLTKGIKLNKEANSGKIYAINIPSGIKDFECKLYKGSSSTTNVEVSLLINDTIIAVSDKFNDDEIHTFKVSDINKSGPFKLEIKNNKSVTIVIDDICWTSFNASTTSYIESSHKTVTDIIATVDESYFKNATITINAKNIGSALTLTAPERFLISDDNVTFGNSIVLDVDTGVLLNKNIYIRLDPIQAIRKYSGTLILSADGVDDYTIDCIGATRPLTYTDLIINEVDADTRDVTGTSSTDEYDFIELYSGNPGVVSLDGYVLVTYNGSNNQVDKNYSLDGYTTNPDGYFVMGNTAVINAITSYQEDTLGRSITPESMVENNSILQNGPDAVALFYGVGGDFSNGDTISTLNLVDAMVFTLSDEDDHYPTGLMPLLNPLQPYVNENAYEDSFYDKQTNSMGRILNGEGGPRNTFMYASCYPTPGTENISLLGEDGLPTQSKMFVQQDQISGGNMLINIKGSTNGIIHIYNLNGSLVKSIQKQENNTTIALRRGIYIVKLITSHDNIIKIVSTY